MCEVGAGTGGMTRDAFPTLDVDNNCEILQYTATDISSVWAPRLLESINTTKLQFKARTTFAFSCVDTCDNSQSLRLVPRLSFNT